MTGAAPELATAGLTLVGGVTMLTEYAVLGLSLVVLGALSYVLVDRGVRIRRAGA